MAATQHNDVEFIAQRDGDEKGFLTHTWDAARAYMVGFAGKVDVLVYSVEGAAHYGGADAIDAYNEDPESSVFERWIRKNPDDLFECIGRVA